MSVNATTPRASQHALTGLGADKSLGADNYHKFIMSCLTCDVALCRSQGERSVITTIPQDLQPTHNSLDCHVHTKQITMIFVIH